MVSLSIPKKRGEMRVDFLSARAKELHQGAIRAMFDKSSTMTNVVNMGIGEPDMATPLEICEAGNAALKAGDTHYTANAGTMACRKAVVASKWLKSLNYDPASEIIITPGAMGALALLIAVVVNPGDEVLIQDPEWLNYASQVAFFGGVPVPVPAKAENNFVIEASEIEKRITKKTKMLMLNSPNNPTGCVIPLEQLKEIAEVVKKHDLLVSSDEVYSTLCYGCEAVSISTLPGMRERTIVINSLSKAFAMTGWRLGFAAGPAEIIKKMVPAQENISACANASAQAAAVYALSHMELSDAIREVFVKRREYVLAELDKIEGIKYCVPRGGFYVFPDIRSFGLSSNDFCNRLLEQERLVTIPGSAFGDCGEGFIRMSYTCGGEDLAEAMRRFSRYCESLRRVK